MLLGNAVWVIMRAVRRREMQMRFSEPSSTTESDLDWSGEFELRERASVFVRVDQQVGAVQCGTPARYLPPSTACHAGTLHVRHGKPPVHQTDLRPVPVPTKPRYASCASSHAASRGRQKYCLFVSGTAPGNVSPRVPLWYVHLFRGPCHMTNTGLFTGQEQGGNYNKATGARKPRVGNSSSPQSPPCQNSMVILGIAFAVSTLYSELQLNRPPSNATWT